MIQFALFTKYVHDQTHKVWVGKKCSTYSAQNKVTQNFVSKPELERQT